MSCDLTFWDIPFQTVITQINHAIGASGIVSQECKSLVSEYGKTILEMLLAKVYKNHLFSPCGFVVYLINSLIMVLIYMANLNELCYLLL